MVCGACQLGFLIHTTKKCNDSCSFDSIYFVVSLKILFFIFQYRPILKLWWSSWILIFRRNENFVRDHPMINHVEFPFN